MVIADDSEDPRSPLRRVPPLSTAVDAAIAADPEISGMRDPDLVDAVTRLRADKDAVILAHNYQIPVIQDLADFVGDSLQLAQQAAASEASVIVFCGVHFMAETAAVLCPDKRVLSPDPAAGCSLAETVTAADIRHWRAENPGGIVVAYVNTDAAVKAEVDVCCTSSNAVQVIASLPKDREILFVPDRFLGSYVQQVTGRAMNLWLGECHVHAAISADNVNALFARYPDADLLLHPECSCVGSCLPSVVNSEMPPERTHVLSTGGMVQHSRECPASIELIGTEIGLLHRLRQENPAKTFVPLRTDAICSYMKAITLPKLYRSLRDEVHQVTVPGDIADRARVAIDRMLTTT